MLDFMAEVLSKVSLLFQNNDITLAAAKDGLEVAWLQLKAMVAPLARNFSEFLNAIQYWVRPIIQGVELRSRPNDLERLAEERWHVAASILTKDLKVELTIQFSLRLKYLT